MNRENRVIVHCAWSHVHAILNQTTTYNTTSICFIPLVTHE